MRQGVALALTRALTVATRERGEAPEALAQMVRELDDELMDTHPEAVTAAAIAQAEHALGVPAERREEARPQEDAVAASATEHVPVAAKRTVSTSSKVTSTPENNLGDVPLGRVPRGVIAMAPADEPPPLSLDGVTPEVDTEAILHDAGHALDTTLDSAAEAKIRDVTADLEALDRRLERLRDSHWEVVVPVAKPRITSRYGLRRDPFHGGQRMHRGVDYGGKKGDAVLAAGPGQVLFSGWGGKGAGRAVVIRHPGHLVTQYFHLSRVKVKAGTWVEAGTVIGLMGASGRATGPHLHFQMSHHGQTVDPLGWIGRRVAYPKDHKPKR